MMNRHDLFDQLSAYLDGYLSQQEQLEIEAYCQKEPQAQKELELMKSISLALKKMPEIPLPEDFALSLHERLLAEAKTEQIKDHISNGLDIQKKKKIYQHTWFKSLVASAAVFVFIVAAGAIGSMNMPDMNTANIDKGSSYSHYSMDDNSPKVDSMDRNSQPQTTDYVANEQKALDQEKGQIAPADSVDVDKLAGGVDGRAAINASQTKIIRNASMELEVHSFDEVYNAINSIAKKYQGYMVSSNSYSDEAGNITSGNISIRVSATSLDQAIEEITALGNVKSNSFYGQDVTMEYVDLEARLQQYKDQKERLNQLSDKTDSISEIIQIESELSRVQAEIDSLFGQIKYLKEVTDLATIDVYLLLPSLYDQHISPSGWDNLDSRIIAGFVAGINLLINIFARIIVGVVYVAPIIAVLAVIFAVYRLKKKNKKNS
ncbi:MAG: DUF4349 domain-containing protein [Bacillota bacterium]|jgi:negative regulator of sigma E activity